MAFAYLFNIFIFLYADYMTMINKCSLVLLNYGAILIVSKVYIDRSNVAFKLWCDINCLKSIYR